MKTYRLDDKEMTITKELEINELDTVAGGYIHDGMWGAWEVIDDKYRDLISTEYDLCHAEWACYLYGVSTERIKNLELEALRKKG